jgi:hypothetical protein
MKTSTSYLLEKIIVPMLHIPIYFRRKNIPKAMTNWVRYKKMGLVRIKAHHLDNCITCYVVLIVKFTLVDRCECSICQNLGLRIVCHLLRPNHIKRTFPSCHIKLCWVIYLGAATWAFPKRTPRAATEAAMSCAMFSVLYEAIGLPARRQSASLKYDTTVHASSAASLSMKSRTAKHKMLRVS